MTTELASFGETSSAERLPAIVQSPGAPTAVVLLAHGAGAGMEHPFMDQLALRLVEKNLAVVRYNFPFTAQGRKRPDTQPVAVKAVAAAMAYAHSRFPGLKMFVAGKSFGGRMSSHALVAACPPYVTGAVFFGFPLHPPGKPSTERASHLKRISVPMLFLQGTRDSLATWSLISEVTGQLPLSTLAKIDGADHAFKVGKVVRIEDIAVSAADWMNEVLRRTKPD